MSSTFPDCAKEPRPASSGFMLGWDLFRIVVWVVIVVWLDPRLLKWVGGESVGLWLIHHAWVRWLGAIPLGLLAIISTFEILNDPKRVAARQMLATTMGGTVVSLRLDPTLGIPDGPGLRLPAGRWFMTVGTWKRDGKMWTMARSPVETRSTFSFVAKGPDRESRLLQGLPEATMKIAVSKIAHEANVEHTAIPAETFAYLAEPPMKTGSDTVDGIIVLRTNEPDTARTLFTSPAMVSAISILNAATRRWDLTFYPTTAGQAEMRLELPGGLKDEDLLRAMRTVIQTVLEELSRAGRLAA